jgi:hypothetical protein
LIDLLKTKQIKMIPTQIRADEHLGERGKFTRVLSRKNHVFSTNISTKMDFGVTVYAKPDRDDIFDRFVDQPTELEFAHVGDDTLDIEIDDLVVNKVHSVCSIRPNASVNAWDHSPADTAKLLPYLCEDLIKKNTILGAKATATMGWKRSGVDYAGPASFSAAPNNTVYTRGFNYFPKVMGKLFVARETAGSKVSESDIYDSCAITEKKFQVAALLRPTQLVQFVSHEYLLRMITAFSTTADIVGDESRTGQDGFALAFDSDLATTTGRQVWRTNNRNMYLVLSAEDYFHTDQSTHSDGAVPPTLSPLLGFFAFPLQFDLQIEFGRDGKAVTQAVTFSGDDITEEVLFGDFLRMDVWKPYQPVPNHAQRYVVDQYLLQPHPGSILTQFSQDRWAKVSLFLPKRRYTFTERVAPDPNDVTVFANSPHNLPELMSAPRNAFIDAFKAPYEAFIEATEIVDIGMGITDQRKMVDLQHVIDEELIRERFPISYTELYGDVTAVWGVYGTTRVLTGLKTKADRELGKYLTQSRDGVDANTFKMLVLNPEYEFATLPDPHTDGTSLRLVKKFPAWHHGWYPRDQDDEKNPNEDDEKANGVQVGDDPNDKLYVLYKADGLQEVGGDIVLNGNCLSIWNSAGFKNSVTEHNLEVEKGTDADALSRRTQYDTTVNRLERLRERATGALLHDPFQINEAIITDGVGGHLQHKPGYMQSLISPFYTHTPVGAEPDGSGAFANVRTGNNPYQTPDPAPYYQIETRFVDDFTDATPGTDVLLLAYEVQVTAFMDNGVNFQIFTDELAVLGQELVVLQATQAARAQDLAPLTANVTLLATLTAARQALIDAGADPGDAPVLLFDAQIYVQQAVVNGEAVALGLAQAAVTAATDAVTDKQTEITNKQAQIDGVNNAAQQAAYEAAMLILTDEMALLVIAFNTATATYNTLAAQLAEMDAGDGGYGALQAQVAAALLLVAAAQTNIDNKQLQINALEAIVLTTHHAIGPWLQLQARDHPDLFGIIDNGPAYYAGASGITLDEWIKDIVTDLLTDLPRGGAGALANGWGVADPIVYCYEHREDVVCPNKYTLVKQFLAAYQTRNAEDWILEACERVLEGFSGGCFHVTEEQVHEEIDAVGKVELRRCRATEFSFEESLLTLAGTSIFQPSSIYPVVPEFPPIIQDFEFATAEFASYYRTDQFCKYSDLVGVFDPQPDVNYSLGTVSKNVFRQEDKSLQTINMRVPIFETFSEQFTPSTVADTRYVVPFSTVQGPPSWVFICVERVEQADSLYSRYPIQIKSLQLEVMSQDIKTFSTLSEFRLQEATKRNSNLRSDQRALALETGGILLSKEDFCRFVDFNFYTAQDSLEGAFVIRQQDLRFKPLGVIEDQLNAAVRTSLDGGDFRVVVQFVFDDHVLEGAAGSMRFRMPPVRMEKLDGFENEFEN